jgi:uncharacterized membrane protein YbaN (DUF454 family)
MKKALHNSLLLALGWLFVVLGVIGVLLPIVPTTPFLIVALTLFSKSSPRFHQMLLTNKWFGSTLSQWEETKTLSRRTKYKASLTIVFSFGISIAMLSYDARIQLLLMGVAAVLLFCLWRVREPS